MGDERFGSNYWRSISVRRNAENVGVEGGDKPAREAVVGDQGRSVAHHNFEEAKARVPAEETQS